MWNVTVAFHKGTMAPLASDTTIMLASHTNAQLCAPIDVKVTDHCQARRTAAKNGEQVADKEMKASIANSATGLRNHLGTDALRLGEHAFLAPYVERGKKSKTENKKDNTCKVWVVLGTYSSGDKRQHRFSIANPQDGQRLIIRGKRVADAAHLTEVSPDPITGVYKIDITGSQSIVIKYRAHKQHSRNGSSCDADRPEKQQVQEENGDENVESMVGKKRDRSAVMAVKERVEHAPTRTSVASTKRIRHLVKKGKMKKKMKKKEQPAAVVTCSAATDTSELQQPSAGHPFVAPQGLMPRSPLRYADRGSVDTSTSNENVVKEGQEEQTRPQSTQASSTTARPCSEDSDTVDDLSMQMERLTIMEQVAVVTTLLPKD